MTIHRTWHTLININNMKFQRSLFRVCLIFYIRFCELQKASGITPWKKCYSLLRWPTYYRMYSSRRFTVQNKPAAVAPKETITHHFFVSGIGQKTVDAAKICGGAENVDKTKPANIRKWIARFYYFRHLYSAGSAWPCAHNNCMSCPSIWATLSTAH